MSEKEKPKLFLMHREMKESGPCAFYTGKTQESKGNQIIQKYSQTVSNQIQNISYLNKTEGQCILSLLNLNLELFQAAGDSSPFTPRIRS